MTAPDALSAAASEHAALQIDGRELDVLALEGEEAVSRLFCYRLRCRTTDEWADPEGLLGKDAAIELRDGVGASRTIRGIVAEAEATVFDEGRTLLVVAVRPAVYRLRLGRDCRVYQDATVQEIVQQVLDRAGLPARWQLGRSYPKRIYTQQYREDDWSFVERLLEEEGIYYWFDHEGADSALVFADESEGASDLVGGALLEFHTETGMQASRELVHQLGARSMLTEDRHTLHSFDPERPNLSVASDQGGGDLEIYDGRGAGPADPELAQARAQTRLEAAKARRATVSGASSSIRLVPGRAFELEGHLENRFDGRYFVTETELSIVQRQREGGGPESRPPECRFGALRSSQVFRAPLDTSWPRQHGLQSAVVIGPAGEEVYPDASGRVRLQYHWDRQGVRDETAGRWMRVVQRGTAGSMLLPRMGWNVTTFNEEGAVDGPMVLSRLFDAEHPPP